MANRKDYYFDQIVTEGELDAGFEGLELADLAQATDFGFFGIVGASDIVPVTTPTTPGIQVDVLPLSAYDQLGRRIRIPLAVQDFDISVDVNNIPTAVAVGKERWVSIYAKFERVLSDDRIDGNNVPVKFARDEGYVLEVRMGAQDDIGLATRPAVSAPTNTSDPVVLLADVRRLNPQVTIVAGEIYTGTETGSRMQRVGTQLANDAEKLNRDGSQTMLGALRPESTGIELGEASRRWDAFVRNLDISNDVIGDLIPQGATDVRNVGSTTKRWNAFLAASRLYGNVTIESPVEILGNLIPEGVAGGRSLGNGTKRWNARVEEGYIYSFLQMEAGAKVKSDFVPDNTASQRVLGAALNRWDAFVNAANLDGTLTTTSLARVGGHWIPDVTGTRNLGQGGGTPLRWNLFANDIDVGGNITPLASGQNLGTTGERWKGFFSEILVTTDDILGNVTGNLVPTGAHNLGSAAKPWAMLYLTSFTVTGDFLPGTPDVSKLGNSSNRWDAFLNDVNINGLVTIESASRVAGHWIPDVTGTRNLGQGGGTPLRWSLFGDDIDIVGSISPLDNVSDLGGPTRYFKGAYLYTLSVKTTVGHGVLTDLVPDVTGRNLGATGREWDAILQLATIYGELALGVGARINGDFIPLTDNVFSLGVGGAGTLRWKDLYLGGSAFITSILNVSGSTTLNGLTVTGAVASSLIPIVPDILDIGSAINYWKNVYTKNLSFQTGGKITGNMVPVGSSQVLGDVASFPWGTLYVTDIVLSSGGRLTGDYIPLVANTQDLGSAALPWDKIYAQTGFRSTHTFALDVLNIGGTQPMEYGTYSLGPVIRWIAPRSGSFLTVGVKTIDGLALGAGTITVTATLNGSNTILLAQITSVDIEDFGTLPLNSLLFAQGDTLGIGAVSAGVGASRECYGILEIAL
jgi:hypothetical protein